jgi:holo-[acyl-carrier protein] synthase
MVKGSGIDILLTDRFESLENKSAFIENILTPNEVARSSRYARRNNFYAALFTLKEAILKAFGCGLRHGSFWQRIEIDSNMSLRISRSMFDLAARQPVKRIHVSVACTKDYTLSIALAEAEGSPPGGV